MSITGVVFYAAGHPRLAFWLALAGGLSAAASMAGSDWLSSQGPAGSRLAACAAMGAATLAGSVLPALPFLLLHGAAALSASAAALCGVAILIAGMRDGTIRAWTETLVILASVLAFSALCALVFPGGIS